MASHASQIYVQEEFGIASISFFASQFCLSFLLEYVLEKKSWNNMGKEKPTCDGAFATAFLGKYMMETTTYV